MSVVEDTRTVRLGHPSKHLSARSPQTQKRNKDKFRRGHVVFGCNEAGTISFNLTFRIEQWLKYALPMLIVRSRDVATTGYTTIMRDDLGANIPVRIVPSSSSSSCSRK